MEFSVASSLLMAHLQTVSKAINPKSASVVPVLGNILFEIEGGRLTLTAADMNNRLTSSLEISNLGSDGSFMVSDNILHALRELPDQPLTIKVDAEYKSRINYANGFYDFLAQSADTFPAGIDLEGEVRSVNLSAEGLLAGLNATRFAAGTDEKRPIMTGVLLDFQTSKLVYVASDGRILVRYTDTQIDSQLETKLCLPPTVCKLLTGTILPKETGEVRLSFDGKYLQIELSGFILTARLLDGTYPAYNSVIPPSSPHHVIVDREALLYAAKRISLFANRASKLILLEIHPDHITLKANDVDFSTAAEESIPSQSDDIELVRIGFEFDLLRSLLEGIDSEQIMIALADQTRAGIISPMTAPEGIEILSLIIPIKLIGNY